MPASFVGHWKGIATSGALVGHFITAPVTFFGGLDGFFDCADVRI
jgi:hypothetical protein